MPSFSLPAATAADATATAATAADATATAAAAADAGATAAAAGSGLAAGSTAADIGAGFSAADAGTAAAGAGASTAAGLGGYGSAIAGTSALLSASTSIAAGQYQKAAYQIQAQNAQSAEALREQSRQQSLTRALGSQMALYGAAGVDPNVGSPTSIYANTAGNTAAANFNDIFSTGAQVNAYKSNANVAQLQGIGQGASSIFNFGALQANRSAGLAQKGSS